jgi:hypothetical protein
MCLACEEQQYFFLAWCEDFIARGEMPPGMTADDLQAMGLPLPKPVDPSAPARQSPAWQAAANNFACDSPDE